jgi:hypothetical protein
MNELFVEVVLRGAKIILAGLIGIVVYVFLVGPMGAAGSPQLALECWMAGAIVLLLLETSAF